MFINPLIIMQIECTPEVNFYHLNKSHYHYIQGIRD